MKPIGTITNYFPFLKEETISVLTSVMDAATNYYDFVLRLGNKICDEDVSPEIGYMGAMHVYFAREKKLQEEIREKFKDRPEIMVWTFPFTGQSEMDLYREEAKEIVSKAISTNPPDWMLIDIEYRVGSFLTRNESETFELLKRIESMLDRNQDLACFETYLHSLKTELYESEGESVKTILEHQKGLEIARKFDDVLWVTIITQKPRCKGSDGIHRGKQQA